MIQNSNGKSVILENEIQHIYLEEDEASKHKILLINKIKNPALLSVSLNNTLEDALYNLKEIKYVNNQLLIVSDFIDGTKFEDFIASDDFSYDEKVAAAFTLIKLACLYKKLPNEVINDFLSTDQLYFEDGLFYTREILLLDKKKPMSFKQLVYDFSFLLEALIDPADENTTVFLEYLRNDYNQYTDFTQVKNDFKTIFIYKSKTALEVTHDFIDIQIVDKASSDEQPPQAASNENTSHEEKKIIESTEQNIESLSSESTQEPPSDSEIDYLLNHPDENKEEQPKSKKNFKELVFPIFITCLAIICIIILIQATLFTETTILDASYVIKDDNGRVVFENNSHSDEPIVEYEWTICYDGQEIKTFNTENFAPVFSTEGTYEIILRVKTDNNWSKPFSQSYTYKKENETTEETPETNSSTN